MECKKEGNLEECNCSYPGCSRKGLCCECVKHHRERGELPACFFSEKAEKSYDRSIARFVEENS
ncbi:MAG: hypothetical protein JW744_01325 [Candidatus Diapherotrites archaeon]|uniref:Cytosolic protein n=1 Tax=Candidatus Iainarchaeum sp. TaxID=3101447 RepID=A0A938YVX3_9ARCH|nr:hypothetical protein [Candidatus Diapherotrites archaeon]